jgi:hypothetical protein
MLLDDEAELGLGRRARRGKPRKYQSEKELIANTHALERPAVGDGPLYE